MAGLLDTTERTVYRYFDLIRECCFDLQRDEFNRFFIGDERSNGVRFTDEEATFLKELVLTDGKNNKLKERQREGIELAKIRGVYKGRANGSKEDIRKFLSKPKVAKTIEYLKKTS